MSNEEKISAGLEKFQETVEKDRSFGGTLAEDVANFQAAISWLATDLQSHLQPPAGQAILDTFAHDTERQLDTLSHQARSVVKEPDPVLTKKEQRVQHHKEEFGKAVGLTFSKEFPELPVDTNRMESLRAIMADCHSRVTSFHQHAIDQAEQQHLDQPASQPVPGIDPQSYTVQTAARHIELSLSKLKQFTDQDRAHDALKDDVEMFTTSIHATTQKALAAFELPGDQELLQRFTSRTVNSLDDLAEQTRFSVRSPRFSMSENDESRRVEGMKKAIVQCENRVGQLQEHFTHQAEEIQSKRSQSRLSEHFHSGEGHGEGHSTKV